MSAAALIRQAQESGVVLRLEGGKVKASGPREAVVRFLEPLREHRAELVQELHAATEGATTTTPANEPGHLGHQAGTPTPTPAAHTPSNPHVDHLQALGLGADEAAATAQRLQAHLLARRWDFDDRVMCWHCAALRPQGQGWQCGNWRAAGIGAPALGRDLMNLPQRCGGYVGIRLVAQK